MQYDSSTTRKYIVFLREHVITPVHAEVISESCFATAVLVFAAIDGLGNLTHPKAKVRSGDRFKHFISMLGEDYGSKKDALWRLRCDLAHNAMNANTFMSKLPETQKSHLLEYNGSLLVNTTLLTIHFEKALDQLESDLRQDGDLLARTESRCTRQAEVSKHDDTYYDQCFTPMPDFAITDDRQRDWNDDDGAGF